GMTNSFGVFQEYYTTTHPPTISSGATAISWIGTIQFWLCPLLGCISGPLFDAGYLKSLVGVGGALYVFSLMMTSLAKEYYQFLLAHGFGVGIGMGLIFSPSVSTLSHHFGRSRWRTLAYGCQATGSSLAGIIVPVLLRQLFPAVGFAWAMRILGFIVLVIVTCAFFFLSRVHPPRKELALLSPSVFRNKAYTVYVMGAGLGSLAIFYAYVLGPHNIRQVLRQVAADTNSVAIGNGCSIFGRIIPLIIAQKVGTINMFTLFALISGTMLFLWTTARTVEGFLIYEAFYGVASGAYAASLNPGAASFAPEPNQSGLYLGMCFFTTAWFWLPGTPATAALIQGKTDYLPASIFCGCAVLGGGMILIGARFMRAKQLGSKWV
ncbi:major facilitator superfamily domain-containing protein, partial [Dioszegia hungarica]